MHAGRKRFRPILTATFALVAGMLPVAIIGGTITSTLLTLLVIPSFDDSIEISRDRAMAKFQARAAHWNPFFAFVVTWVEALLTLVLLGALWRGVARLWAAVPRRRGAGPVPAA